MILHKDNPDIIPDDDNDVNDDNDDDQTDEHKITYLYMEGFFILL